MDPTTRTCREATSYTKRQPSGAFFLAFTPPCQFYEQTLQTALQAITDLLNALPLLKTLQVVASLFTLFHQTVKHTTLYSGF